MIFGASKNKRDRQQHCVFHSGIPSIRNQLHRGVPYVLTPWLTSIARLNHDAIANVAFAALWSRLAKNSERKAIGAAGCGRCRLLHLEGH